MREKIEILQVGRALAAIAVVLSHAGQASDAFTPVGADAAINFDWGAYGVDFFFVLSGFIIYHIHKNDRRDAQSALLFARKRVARVYIPYLPIGIGMMVLYTLFPNVSASNREWGVVTTLFLVPTHATPALSVAWTLVYEMLFYAFFLLFYVSRHFPFFAGVWAVCVVAATASGAFAGLRSPFLDTALNLLILEFLAGMAVAHVSTRISPKAWMWFLGAGLFGCTAFLTVHALDLATMHRVFIGAPLALVVLGSVMYERCHEFRIPALLLHLGAGSYAIYLVHGPIISLAARLLTGAESWFVTFVGATAAGIAAGMAYHLIFERPVLAKLQPRSGVVPKANAIAET